ncbi:MAG: two-component sensor histidine kinase [Desulfobulbaceae bacterium]|uniref:histidine kinase n=1 Tax=Candidatus Desulfobia pelagia TaxID=2841692 RepID=A0A8J6NFJ2_9BACT|nr:two-component sensor histidine kinase [Candidatus Desulfobia pelagia]
MTDQYHNNEKGPDIARLKPFRLVKFFSFTSLAVILASTLVLSWIISNYTKKVLLYRSEAYTFVLAKNMSHQVFQQFVLPLALQNRQIALQDPRQFDQLDKIVENAIHGMNIDSVTIYSKKENLVSYSTVPEIVGKRDLGRKEYEKALEGQKSSVLIMEGSLLNLLPGSDDIYCLLRTFVPLRKERPFSKEPEVMGVIEIAQDLSDDLAAIIRLQAIIVVTSIIIMGALFVSLRFIVARADRIIEARAAERRRLEVKLHQAERLASLGKMVASVSHEIKNPLGIVRSTAEILGKRLQKIAPGNDHLAKIIVEETTRLDSIVREFLDFARPKKPVMVELAVNDILRRVTGFMSTEFVSHQIDLDLKLAKALPHIQGDFDQLYQSCLNILVNSVQAMPEGGILVVESRLSKDGGSVMFEITDSGEGMTEEAYQQMFNPFFTSKNRGSGLGLAIVKNIIDGHHGTINVVSSEGEGTKFTLLLPVFK